MGSVEKGVGSGVGREGSGVSAEGHGVRGR